MKILSRHREYFLHRHITMSVPPSIVDVDRLLVGRNNEADLPLLHDRKSVDTGLINLLRIHIFSISIGNPQIHLHGLPTVAPATLRGNIEIQIQLLCFPCFLKTHPDQIYLRIISGCP